MFVYNIVDYRHSFFCLPIACLFFLHEKVWREPEKNFGLNHSFSDPDQNPELRSMFIELKYNKPF